MIEKIKVLELVKGALDGTDKFLVNLKITPDNRIFVDIDGDNGIVIDDCIALSRAIEQGLNRDEEDFELNVGSAGADEPLKLARQYRRHIGRQLSIVTTDGESFTATLTAADNSTVGLHQKGQKKAPPRDVELPYDKIKEARVVIDL
ncbi:MAG: ribosome assembly cofactor RimP [Bacteroidales bacterium]|nr:ribosome assembly cofactor RimP [Bacteroidales bacterium]